VPRSSTTMLKPTYLLISMDSIFLSTNPPIYIYCIVQSIYLCICIHLHFCLRAQVVANFQTLPASTMPNSTITGYTLPQNATHVYIQATAGYTGFLTIYFAASTKEQGFVLASTQVHLSPIAVAPQLFVSTAIDDGHIVFSINASAMTSLDSHGENLSNSISDETTTVLTLLLDVPRSIPILSIIDLDGSMVSSHSSNTVITADSSSTTPPFQTFVLMVSSTGHNSVVMTLSPLYTGSFTVRFRLTAQTTGMASATTEHIVPLQIIPTTDLPQTNWSYQVEAFADSHDTILTTVLSSFLRVPETLVLPDTSNTISFRATDVPIVLSGVAEVQSELLFPATTTTTTSMSTLFTALLGTPSLFVHGLHVVPGSRANTTDQFSTVNVAPFGAGSSFVWLSSRKSATYWTQDMHGTRTRSMSRSMHVRSVVLTTLPIAQRPRFRVEYPSMNIPGREHDWIVFESEPIVCSIQAETPDRDGSEYLNVMLVWNATQVPLETVHVNGTTTNATWTSLTTFLPTNVTTFDQANQLSSVVLQTTTPTLYNTSVTLTLLPFVNLESCTFTFVISSIEKRENQAAHETTRGHIINDDMSYTVTRTFNVTILPVVYPPILVIQTESDIILESDPLRVNLTITAALRPSSRRENVSSDTVSPLPTTTTTSITSANFVVLSSITPRSALVALRQNNQPIDDLTQTLLVNTPLDIILAP
jgi:hypothetical protein